MPTSFSKIATSLRAAFLAALLLTGALAAGQASVLCGASAGKAKAEIRGAVLSLSNQMMQAQWSVAERKLTALTLAVRTTGAEVSLPRVPFSFMCSRHDSRLRECIPELENARQVDMGEVARHSASYLLRGPGAVFDHLETHELQFALLSPNWIPCRAFFSIRYSDATGTAVQVANEAGVDFI
jgi:hypothetical protein